ncbi:MAG: potassium transporter TrkH [Alphaproteobacteria bacterium HGW-Alphaproteobacteria-8]|nr:MAG: potassium transporter TrkH [Alphaproteobacteria bacterium HGW-Alphaproteobacteria-8]
MGFVLLTNGLALILAGLLMALDAAIFPDTADVFMTASIVTITLGATLSAATAARRDELRTVHTFMLTGTVWLTAATAGAAPLTLWGLSPTDAFFEAMSGITTTGSTVMIGLDATPHGILMWRAVLQWIGGIGFIVTGIALLPILKVGGMQLFRTESSERGEKELGSAARFAAATLWIYVVLTMACAITYIAGGMTPFEAIAHALTTLSTGGYSTSDGSIGHFGSGFLEWSATLFMLSGALPFAWYIRAVNRRIFRSEQVAAFVASLAAFIALLTAWRIATSNAAPLDALREVAFNVVSVVTTTGFATTDYTLWGPLAAVAFLVLTAVGGCTGSTAGGAKMMRWIVFYRAANSEVRRVHHPHGVFVPRYEGRPIAPDVLSGVVSFFTFYVLTFWVMAFALSFLGLDFSTSVSGALTALANVGPGVGPIIGPSGNFATLPDTAKWILAFGMYLGRLEMLTIFVLLTPAFWREAT